jgi:acylphosphatase
VSDERLTARVTGRVQGVGYRWWIQRHADALGLTGWVMNADDERAVELLAEGPSTGLDSLERLLREGPRGARVESIHVNRTAASGEFDRFSIVRA